MRKTKRQALQTKMCMTIEELAQTLSVGRSTAEKLAKESKAIFKAGRLTLVYMPKLQDYLEQLTGGEENG